MTYQGIRKKIISLYSGVLDEAEREADLIISYILDINIGELIAKDPIIDDEVINNIMRLARKRALERIPLAYIIKKWHFYGLEFFVDENVLIPRRETEQLVELILEENDITQKKMLDIGSGSGCISIAIGKNRPTWDIIGIDISKNAIELSNKNIDKNDCKNIEFKECDLFSDEIFGFKEFDIIVSNPPYIPERYKTTLPEETLKEPEKALFAKDDGLIFYKNIKNISRSIMKNKGRVYFEIDPCILEGFLELFKDENIKIFKDYSGNERMVRWNL